MKSITFVTGNENKFREISEVLTDIELKREKLDLIEIQSFDIEVIARFKAQEAYTILNKPVLIEDTGFYIDALKGFPGPFIKFAHELMGDSATIQMLGNNPNRKAYARTVFVYFDGNDYIIGNGILEGELAYEMRGEDGFRFDYCFIPKGYDKTLAELGLDKKKKISHRTLALKDLLDKLN